MAKRTHSPASAATPARLPAPEQTPPPGEKTEEFCSGYANNLRFQPTVYDLKMIFGETDVSSEGKEIVRQHTAISIPWALVKVSLYYLQVNLAIQEMVNGKVTIPPNQLPPPANPVPPEMVNDPNAHKAKDIVTKLRKEFLDSL
jgi:hypothetical protein